MKAFKILLKVLISIINILNEEGFKLYDADNQDWYINNIRYNEDDDRLYFDLEEDKSIE
ncbi:hypothetical protein PMY56_13460 [Clostridium tertium]|uniref:hypothetical protein n=1 Tax=Clostridium tertium TaxID=1559 RepID=UPI00232C9381|nr:hypothetical protein [Clostridium tertium]MDB1924095.1 hypothetical protein [Clostridium tertium]MDB1927144.1 hypothetical protein [Clostridium tertium]MDB1930921.1 hypothetical protein [Clostridium tertium]